MLLLWLIRSAIVAVACAAAVTDLRRRVVPNWLTIPAIALGFCAFGLRKGAPGQLDRSSALFDPIANTMRSQAYQGWFVMVCEHVVRAVVARLSADPEGVLSVEEERGFRYIRAVAAMLAEYEENRGTFPDFWAFAPRIAAGLAWRAQEAGGYRG